MNANTQALTLHGAAGAIEAAMDLPANGDAHAPVAVIAHPHPLFAGTMDNKVVQTLARAFTQAGWRALRFNFRGVGASAGVYDKGAGETEDMLQIVREVAPDSPLALAGFSFGSFVTSHVAERLHGEGRDVTALVLIGTATERFAVAPVPPDWHERKLVVHGEADDTVALSSVMDWARPQNLPVTVMPGVSHFFHGQLTPLKQLVLRHLRAVAAAPVSP